MPKQALQIGVPFRTPNSTRDFPVADWHSALSMRSRLVAMARSTPPGVAARTKGNVLWCITRPDLLAPALAQPGLAPARVIYVETGDDKTVLA